MESKITKQNSVAESDLVDQVDFTLSVEELHNGNPELSHSTSVSLSIILINHFIYRKRKSETNKKNKKMVLPQKLP